MQIPANATLNHLSFPTADIAETAAFFERHLGCEVVAAGEHCLLKRNGFDIVLEHVTQSTPQWPENFHFGLEVESLDEVHALYEAFRADGVQMESEVFNNARGSRFFCRAPGGVLIEINTRADMQRQDQWKQMF